MCFMFPKFDFDMELLLNWPEVYPRESVKPGLVPHMNPYMGYPVK